MTQIGGSSSSGRPGCSDSYRPARISLRGITGCQVTARVYEARTDLAQKFNSLSGRVALGDPSQIHPEPGGEEDHPAVSVKLDCGPVSKQRCLVTPQIVLGD
jgi:hypothetical protein